ncbi:N-methyltryptophan oxidase [Mycolicibacterium madagascariense]|uniref:N-methyltryptophan oxidase n=1 Tax=Mycolicibacterium madagascariense TaxID=212765 RepID=A0A7I7XFI4_9MYCO|nr:N-methyl-L-tryptophan oxidase [Mycolicibacterium madagascariense]MCV7013695.1 N-methyl-L-tryptophan oxidase [Mycolicibacterium madagascariense]BBZ27948.1 N-methyltryptophan oxidase [Mycolicibacterium madagascariense]
MTDVEHRDVVVVGLGSMGSMALWQLAIRGVDVLGLEQFGRVHTYGAYAGESRLFRVAAKEGQLFTPALMRSRELWQELGTAYGQHPLMPVGALSLGPRGHPDIESTLRSIQQYDLPHEILDPAELRVRYPQFHVEDDDVGVFDTQGGLVRSELAVAAASDQALAHGAHAWYDTTVVALEPGTNGVRIVTSRGDVMADRVVVSAGPWTTRLLPELADIVKVVSYNLIWFMPRHIEMFTPDRFPGFMRDLDGVHAFGIPTLDGYSVKATPNLGFSVVEDWDERSTTLTREQLRWAGVQMQKMIPDLMPDASRWSVHGESLAANKMPIIDTVADGAIVVATALSGNGFKFSPVWGEMLADLVTTGRGRFTEHAFTVAAHRQVPSVVGAPG